MIILLSVDFARGRSTHDIVIIVYVCCISAFCCGLNLGRSPRDNIVDIKQTKQNIDFVAC